VRMEFDKIGGDHAERLKVALSQRLCATALAARRQTASVFIGPIDRLPKSTHPSDPAAAASTIN
jgi:hypothetical protein